MTLRTVAHVGAALAAALFVLTIALPGAYLSNYGVDPVPEARFAIQRGAPLFALLALLALAIAQAEPSPLRVQVTLAIAALFVLIAATGIYHVATGQAGATLWVGIAAELAAATVLTLMRHR
ncbi:MAG: hypothetical protein ACU0CO_12395 [Shimia sp.]